MSISSTRPCPRRFRPAAAAAVRLVAVALVLLAPLAEHGHAKNRNRPPPAVNINDCPPELVQLYLYLAHAAKAVYDEPEETHIATEGGCVARVRVDEAGNLVVAFRGSVMPPDSDDHNLDPILRELARLRSRQDWLQTNIRQAFGLMPRQYIEAMDVLIDVLRRHQNANRIYITGHSKGGGEAEFATVAAWLSPDVPDHVKTRMTTVTFNGAVVNELNWRRLYELFHPMTVDAYLRGRVPRLDAVIMRDDIVPKIDSSERHPYPFVGLVVIDPTWDIWIPQQHSIRTVIAELERRVMGYRGPPAY